MELGRIREIHRYPVKSMLGERLESAALDAGGIRGDRAWAVRDEVRGAIGNGKKLPALMSCAARYPTEPDAGGVAPAEIELRSGERIRSDAPDVDRKLSADLDHAVTLHPLAPPENEDHYRRGKPDSDDVQAEMRELFAREPGEPFPDLSGIPPEKFGFVTPPGTYFDLYPLLLLTDASLRRLEQSGFGDARFDVRRFRPNFLIDTPAGTTGFPELKWGEARLRIGECEVATKTACPRCVMTVHGFADLPKDPRIMRALVREANGNLGIYASVETPGRVSVGDSVTLL